MEVKTIIPDEITQMQHYREEIYRGKNNVKVFLYGNLLM